MTLDQLIYMKTIIEEQSFTQAAEVLHISQSCLSKQIASLEEALGIVIFDRTHRAIKLTPIGEVCYAHAQHMLHQYHELLQEVAQYKDHFTKTLNLVSLPTMANKDIRELLLAFDEHHEEMNVELLEAEEKELPALIDLKQYDGFIMREAHELMKGYSAYLISEDELVGVVSIAHRLARSSSFTYEDVIDETVFLMPRYTAITKQLQELVTYKQNRGIRYGRLDNILGQADMGLGIAIVPRKSLSLFHLQDCVVLPLCPKQSCNIYAYLNNNRFHKEAVQAFQETLKEYEKAKSME